MALPSSKPTTIVKGRNGSGKSAILTAVILGLGGTTRTTNRGKNVKELIKYNKHTATIQIVLTNCGKEAYKGDVYGDAIIVERRISSSGMSAFNIKSKS
ncbi:Structural maintenance of chromosomes protein 6, partial [Halocaridina rubra]